MEAFIGRESELEALEKAYAGAGSQFYPVYGRRRVGKTELILRFTRDKPSVFYLGKQASSGYQVREFLEIAAEELGEPLLAEIGDAGWKKALKLVAERRPEGRKLIIVLDEFQWIAGASPELPSLLQELWDLDWSRSDGIFLILCGSYIGFMEREVLGRSSPLFGRRTGQIRLQPFGYREAARFHPRLSREDQARVWFLCGGIPFYLRQFDGDRSVAANIQSNFLTPYAPLFREADFLIREELREVEHYHAILMCLADGSRAAAVLAREAGIPPANIQYYLKTLVELGYVARRYPLTGKKPTVRSVRFALTDPLLQFWFRFVFPHLSRITTLAPGRAYQQLIRPGIESYYGYRFERLCRAALLFLYADDGIEATATIGEYWNKGVQIDVVGIRDDGWIDLGECKWGAIRSWPAAQREVSRKLAAYPNPEKRSLGGWLFSRQTPPEKTRDGIRCVGLDELYGEA